MVKKTLIISAAVFFLLLTIFLVRRFFFSSESDLKQQSEVSQETKTETKKDDVAVNDRLIKLISGRVVSPVLANDGGKIIYYQDQKILTVSLDGKTKNSLGGYPFTAVEELTWSVNQKQAIVKSGQDFYLYSLDTDQAVKTKDGADNIVWSGDDRFFYKYYDPKDNTRSLNLSDKDGSNWKVIVPKLNLSYKKITLSVQPKTAKKCFFPFPDGKNQSQLECLEGEERKVIYQGNFGASYLWSPDGEKLLVSAVQTQGGNRVLLGVMNSQGGQYQGLNFPTTVEKCVWGNNSKDIYCAMLGPAPEQAVLPNDWQVGKHEIKDLSFWKIDTENAKKTRILEAKELSEAINARRLFLDQQEDYLFFQNGENNDLYRLRLK